VLREIRNRAQFQLERFMMRGPIFRLLFVIGIVVGVSVVGGLLVVPLGEFESPNDAIWWAFLRLSDPGYLGDDHGIWKRTVSTVLTVAGYVLFLGALIAIMTQWLNQALRTLEAGVTPISLRNHFVVLGWTTRTATVVQELLESSERVRHFLRRRGAVKIAVLAEDVDANMHFDLRDLLGAAWRADNVILRSGSSLRIEHLRRVASHDAAALLLPAPDQRGSGAAPDTQTIKSLLTLSGYCVEHEVAARPLVVAELLDARKAITARRAYHGPLELIASNRVISSLICQAIRHPGLSHVYAALLTHGEGSELYARECPQFADMRFGDLADAFPASILIGIVRRESGTDRAMLNPSDDLRLRADDRLVLVAENVEATTPPESHTPKYVDRGQGVPQPPEDLAARRRILVLGWNHHVPDMLAELDSYQVERFELVIASMVPIATRKRHMDNHEVTIQRISVDHVEVDYTVPGHLKRLDPGKFDNIVLVANDWIEAEESDARTILGHLLLREIVPDGAGGPEVLVELSDPGNLALFERGSSEVIIPPLALSHIMAQVALRRELRVVFDDLFGPEGTEVFFRPAQSYGLEGTEVDFAEIQRAVAKHNETALGLRRARSAKAPTDGAPHAPIELLINPPRNERWTLGPGDELVVLATYVC